MSLLLDIVGESIEYFKYAVNLHRLIKISGHENGLTKFNKRKIFRSSNQQRVAMKTMAIGKSRKITAKNTLTLKNN